MTLQQPVHEEEASEHVREIYDDIKKTLSIQYVPALFRYAAQHPAFLENFWQSLKNNITDPAFQRSVDDIKDYLKGTSRIIIQDNPELSATLKNFLSKDSKKRIAGEIAEYYDTQCTLALVSVAVRERVKGWAVGIRHLPSDNTQTGRKPASASEAEDEAHEIVLSHMSSAMTVSPDIRKDVLKYIVFIHDEFSSVVRRESYVYARVESEKLFERHVRTMPHPIFASYNEVAQIIPDKNDLPEIFYLLSEKFPIFHAVSALIWAMSIELLGDAADA